MATIPELRAFVFFLVLLCVQNSLQANTYTVTVSGPNVNPGTVNVDIGDTIHLVDGNNGGDNGVAIGANTDVFYQTFTLLSGASRDIFLSPDTYPSGITFRIASWWAVDIIVSGSTGTASAPSKGYATVCQEIDLSPLQSTSNIEFNAGQCTVYTDSLCSSAAVSGASSTGTSRSFYYTCTNSGSSYDQIVKFWQPLPNTQGLYYAIETIYPPLTYSIISNIKVATCTSVTITDPINSNAVTFSSNNCKTYPDGLCMIPVSTPLAVTSGSLEVWISCTAAISGQVVKATSNYGATATSNTFTVYDPIAITSVTPQRATGCAGSATGQLSVTYSGGNPSVQTTFEWRVSGGSTVGSTATVSGVSPGSYDVYVTNGPDTANRLNIVVDDVANPVTLTNAQSNPPKCFGSHDGTATIDASGGTTPYTFTWFDNSNQPISTFTFTPSSTAATALSGQNYKVIVTDGNSCQANHVFTLSDPAKLVVTPLPQTDANCFGDTGSATVSAAGGTGTYSYSWSPSPTVASTSKTATGLVVGIKYTVTVTDINNCQDSTDFTINGPAAPLTATPSFTIPDCFGTATGTASVLAAGGTGPYHYDWKGAGPDQDSIGTLNSGSYPVTVTDSKGCTKDATVTFADPPKLVISHQGQTNLECNGDGSGEAFVEVSGGTGAYSYSWPSGVSSTSKSASGLSATTYVLNVKDIKNCPLSVTFIITQPDPITATYTQKDVKCKGDSTGEIVVTAQGGNSGYQYTWTPTSASTTSKATNLKAGSYTFSVTDSKSCAPFTSASITITEPTTALSVTPSHVDLTCFGVSTGEVSVSASGGTGSYTYAWSNSLAPVAKPSSTLAAGTYTSTVTDANGCKVVQDIVLSQPEKLIISSQDQKNLKCNGDNSGEASVVVSGGTGAYSYTWPSGVSSTSKSATGLAPNTYVLNVKDVNNCPLSVTFVITQPDPITATYTQKDVLCKGDSTGEIVVTAQGGNSGYKYTWTPTSASTTSKASVLKAGSYTFSVTDSNNCAPFTSASITITEPTAALSVTPSHVDLTCHGVGTGEVSVSASGGTEPYTYAWSNSLAPVAKPSSTLTAGTYTSTVTGKNGCKVVQDIVLSQPDLFAIQPAFTPVKCYGGSATLQANATGGTEPYAYSWYPAGGADSATTLVPSGIYQITATDSCAVARIQSVIVSQPTQLVIVPSQTNVACNGDASGTAYAYASGGTPPYTYSWSPSGGELATATGLVAGSYTVTVTDANGCQATQRFIITQFDPISINYIPFNATCHGTSTGNVSLAVTGGSRRYMYSWFPQVSNGAGASALAAGTYRVTVSDSSFCSATEDIEISEPQVPP